LDIRTPFAGITDEKDLVTELQNWKTWGWFHQGADLTYLKEVMHKIGPVEPATPRVASEIKGMAGKTDDKLGDTDVVAQLFLLLAQEFDQESLELEEQLTWVEQEQQALHAFLQIDDLEDNNRPAPEKLFPETESDSRGFLVKNRMAAWNHLFQKDPVESCVLLTDLASAGAFLMDDIEDKVEVLNLEIPFPQGSSDGPQWKDDLAMLFQGILTKTWDSQLQIQIEESSKRIQAMALEDRKTRVESTSRKAAWRWYLVPRVEPSSFLDKRCGPGRTGNEKGNVKNTLVGLVELLRK
jgi:hypothetical protein